MLNSNFVVKNISALFLLLKLLSGIIAIIFAFQDFKSLVIASYTLFLALFFDFLSDFPFKNTTNNLQNDKKLNVLINMVSFGVAPSAIIYALLKTDLQIQQFSLSLPLAKIIVLLMPWLFAIFSAISLSKTDFNNHNANSSSGIKIHISVLFIAALPLMAVFDPYNLVLFPQLGKSTYFFFGSAVLSSLLTKSYVVSSLCILLASFIVIEVPMFSLKFTNFNFEENKLKYFFLIISGILFLFIQVIAIPFIFILYITFSIFNNLMNKKLRKFPIH